MVHVHIFKPSIRGTPPRTRKCCRRRRRRRSTPLGSLWEGRKETEEAWALFSFFLLGSGRLAGWHTTTNTCQIPPPPFPDTVAPRRNANEPTKRPEGGGGGSSFHTTGRRREGGAATTCLTPSSEGKWVFRNQKDFLSPTGTHSSSSYNKKSSL